MRALVIEVGRAFGRLRVVKEAERGTRGRRFLCACSCGNEKTIPLPDLIAGDTKSCGCYGDELRKANRPPLNVTHGFSRHDGTKLREYGIWQAIKDRCLNPRNKFYSYYGGRGIGMFEGWINDFPAFLNHVGMRPDPKLQIDRIDNERGYEPGNVRWASKAVQMANRRPYKKKVAQ